jgi:hypothetical protein
LAGPHPAAAQNGPHHPPGTADSFDRAIIVAQVPPPTRIAEVLIDRRKAKFADIEAVSAHVRSGPDIMESQVRGLRSRNLTYKLIESRSGSRVQR